MIKWRSIKAGQIPDEDQECLTQMKDGFISGTYDDIEQLWNGYYYEEMGWYADKWVPVEELVDSEGGVK